jgi:hypothetical protein
MSTPDVRFEARYDGRGKDQLYAIPARGPERKIGQPSPFGLRHVGEFLVNGGLGDICHMLDDLREPVKPTVEPVPDEGGLTADEIAWVRGHRELFLAREDEGAAPVFATDEDTGSICALLAGFNEMKRRGANFFCTQPDRSLVLAELIDERIAAREKAAADAAKLAEPESKRTLSQITLDLLSRLREGNDVVIPRVWPGKSYHDTRMISSLLRGRWLMEDGSPDKVIDNFAGKPESESINEFAPLGSHDDCDEIRMLKAEIRDLKASVKTLTKSLASLESSTELMRPDLGKIFARAAAERAERAATGQSVPVADAATDDDDREAAIAIHAQSPV